MQKVLVAIDPEYSRAGISVYVNGKICITDARTEPNKDKSFEQVYKDAEEQSSRIMRAIEEVIVKEIGDELYSIEVLSECPPPQGQFSSGLYALDTLLFYKLRILACYKLYRVYPTYINHIHGKRKYPKSESVTLATDMLELSGIEFEVMTKRFSHDQAESLIFLMRLLVINDILGKELTTKYPVLLEEKEKRLY